MILGIPEQAAIRDSARARWGCSVSIYARQGNLDEALTYAEKTYAAIPVHPNAIGFFAGMLTRTGQTTRAREVLQKLERGRPYGVPRARANFHLVCGELDTAADWTEKAVSVEREVKMLKLGFVPLAGKTRSRWPPPENGVQENEVLVLMPIALSAGVCWCGASCSERPIPLCEPMNPPLRMLMVSPVRLARASTKMFACGTTGMIKLKLVVLPATGETTPLIVTLPPESVNV